VAVSEKSMRSARDRLKCIIIISSMLGGGLGFVALGGWRNEFFQSDEIPGIPFASCVVSTTCISLVDGLDYHLGRRRGTSVPHLGSRVTACLVNEYRGHGPTCTGGLVVNILIFEKRH
jgi:hypothetical protein